MNIKQLKPSKSSRYQQGYIDPSSCKKIFEGMEKEKIIYRSSYERTFIYWLENNKNVKGWGSECIKIPYMYIDGQWHSYYPDYFVEFVDGRKMVVEIKPSSQTVPPKSENNWYTQEYRKNMCKWKATKEFCENKGYIFRIFTEKTMQNL